MDRLCDEILKNIEQIYGFNEEQKEIARYGLQGFFEIGSNFLISLFILYRMDMIKEGITFFLVFIPVRMFSGGYHLETYFKCLIFSVITLIGVLELGKVISVGDFMSVFIMLLVTIIMWNIAPVIHPNRPVSLKEYNQITKRMKITLMLVFSLNIVLRVFRLELMSNIVMLCMVLILTTLVIGKIKYKECQIQKIE